MWSETVWSWFVLKVLRSLVRLPLSVLEVFNLKEFLKKQPWHVGNAVDSQSEQAFDASESLFSLSKALEDELFVEAVAASASRLQVEELSIGKASILLDLHISEGSKLTPFALDTHGYELITYF